MLTGDHRTESGVLWLDLSLPSHTYNEVQQLASSRSLSDRGRESASTSACCGEGTRCPSKRSYLSRVNETFRHCNLPCDDNSQISAHHAFGFYLTFFIPCTTQRIHIPWRVCKICRQSYGNRLYPAATTSRRWWSATCKMQYSKNGHRRTGCA